MQSTKKEKEVSEIRPDDITSYLKASSLLINSMEPLRRGEAPSAISEFGFLISKGLSGTYDEKSVKLIKAIKDPSKLARYVNEASVFLNYFKIDRGQLAFVEKLSGLDKIVIKKVFPEGKRAYAPLLNSMGIEADFNRLNVYADHDKSLVSFKDQLEYLEERLRIKCDEPTEFIDNFTNYFPFDGIGAINSAYVYLHLSPNLRL